MVMLVWASDESGLRASHVLQQVMLCRGPSRRDLRDKGFQLRAGFSIWRLALDFFQLLILLHGYLEIKGFIGLHEGLGV